MKGGITEILLDCPICHEAKIRTTKKESYQQASTSRIAGQSKTKYHTVPEKYIIKEDCPNCKANKKDIQALYDGEIVETKEHRKERILRSGLPTMVEL